MRKQTKIAVVASAAALLALGASMTSFAAGWTEEDGTWVYLNKDGDRIYNEWKKSGANYYYLNDDGEMATDVVIEHTDGKKYYVDENGVKVTKRWVELDNEDGVSVNDQDVSTLWMYFDAKGRATTGYGKKIDGKYYNFDSDGYMMSGWVNNAGTLYYCGDENEGWAYTGWQNLEADGDLTDVPYDESKWFYFGSNGKATKGVTKYINGVYYTFNADGTLVDNWYSVATPATASDNEAYANVNGTTGLGWVYADGLSDDSEDYWYYLTNIRENGKVIARGVPFGYAKNNESENNYVAKSIKSKTYLFNTYGEMQTGVITLTSSNLDTTVAGSKDLLGNDASAIFYFNEEEGSVEGQMMTGKITLEEDAEVFNYCFDKAGKAYANAIKNGVLYGEDGKRIQAEDGNKYEIITTSAAITYYDKTVSNQYVTIPANSTLLVNASGKIRTSTGNVTIEDIKYLVTFDYVGGTYTVVAQ